MKEVLKLRKRRTGQWVTVAGMVLIGACMTIGNTVVFADDTQTYPIEASNSNKFNLTDSPSPLSSENLGTNNRGHEVATLPSTGHVDSSAKTTPEYLMSESSTVSLVTSDVATTETSTSVLASLSEVAPTKSTDSSETLVPSTLSEDPKHSSTSEGAVAEVKSHSETLVEHSTNSNNEEESGDNLIYDIHNQEVTITDIKRKETIKKLIIPQRISNYRVTEIGSSAFSGSSLKEVVLPKTLTKIGDSAFSGTQLTRLTLPEGITEIGSSAFSGSSLKEVVLPSTLTKIGNSAFSGTQLKDITLPTSVTTIGSRAFGSIDSLSSVVIPKNLSNAFGAFEGSQHLKTIHFEEGITKIADGLFKGSGISSITIPKTVTEIGYEAFRNTRITELYIPDSVTKLESNSFGFSDNYSNVLPSLTKVSLPSELQSTSSPFYGQKNLKEVVLRGNWKTIPSGLFSGTGIEKLVIPEGVTEIGSSAFSGSSLKEVVLPRTLTKIGDSAFRGTQLTKLTLPEGVTEIGSSAFSGSSLKEVVLPGTLTKIGNSAFSGTQLRDITLPTSVTTIGSRAFGSIDSLSSVVIPKNLSNAYGAFEGSQHLKTIHFEESITKIADGLFKGSGISSITIPKTVTEIGYEAFRNTRITELYIPDSVTKLGDNSFSFSDNYSNDLPSLTKVSLPSELQSTSSPFYGQKNLKEVVLRGNWKSIPGGLFSGTGIEKLVIPEGVTEIGAGAFSGSSLKEVVLPRTLTKIGDSAFSGTQLTRLTLPEGITEIGSSAFSGSSLKEVVLPSTLTKIGNSAFSGTQLRDITLPTSVTTIGSRAFGSIDSLSSVVIPKNLSNAYGAFEGSQHLKTIHFEEGITKIADGLFKGSGISSITIPKTVTEIGYEAFRNTRITELYIPDSVTKLGDNSFSFSDNYSNDLPSLTKVSLPSELQSTSSPFYGQKNLKEVVLRGNWKTIPSGLFSGTGIEKLVIPEGVTEIGSSAFSGSSLKEVVLPRTLTKIGDSAFRGTQLTKLTLPEGVTEIGSSAFSGSSLKEVVLPGTLTKIGNSAFSGTQLRDITLPTSVTTIGSRAFGSIDSLSSVVIPKNLSNAYGAFEGSQHLKTIHFEEGITKIADGLFKGSGISSITIPKTVTEIGYEAFRNTRITELYIPDSVTKLGDNSFSFSDNYSNDLPSLTKVSLPSELQSTSSPFYGQKNLKEVVLRGNWKSIPGGLFSGTGIEKLVIPEGVTEIGAGAFSGSSLKEVVLPRTLTKIGDSAFSGTQLTRLTLPEGITEIGSSAFSGSSLKEVVLPSTLTKIGNSAFSGTQLRDITLPTSVTTIGSRAFGSIDSLSSVVIPKNLSNAYGAFEGSQHLKTIHFEEGITKIADGLFKGSGISSITIPKTVTEIGYEAFRNTRITELYIPDSVTKLGDNSFSFSDNYSNDLPSLTKVSLPSELQSTSSPFYGQKNLKEVVLRGNWKTIPSGLFSGTGIEKLVIPEGVTEIGSSAFSGSSLKEVVLPRTLTKIGDSAFRGTQLTKLTLPEGVTEIGSSAFSGSSLKEVVLPGTLTKIGNSAFSGTQLRDITLPTSVTTIGSRAFGSIDSLSSVVIPKNLSNAYGAFEGSQHLKTIHFEEGITKIADGLFKGSGISSITIPKTVTEIGYEAFRNTRITELYIPDSVTKLGDNSFSFSDNYSNDLPSLTKVSLPSELQSTSSPFYGQKNLKEVVLRGNWKTIPSGLFSGTGIEKLVIPEGVTEIGSSAFSGSSLKEVVLPSTLTQIGSYAFSGTQLTNMSVPSSVREIGSYAFNSTPLEVINLPYGLQVIGSGAFRNTKLETIEIPEGVTYLDDYTLANIPTLKSVYLPKSLTAFVQSWNTPSESVEYHVYLDSFALEYMIEKQLNFKLRDENVANDDSKVLDSSNSYYLTTTTGTRRQGYLGLDLKYAIKKDKSSDDGKYVLHLNIPSTTKVFESKIRVNGQDVTATVSNGYLDIPVSEEVGKIKLMLMTENRELTNVRLFAQLSYQKDRKKISENIGAINVNIPVLTLTANQVTSRSYSRISGVADPNDKVIAYLDDMVVGQVKIKKDGSYTFDIPLVTPVDNKEYTIKVKALSSDGREISETTTVRYEKNYPELVNFIMRHNGYTYNLKENQDKVPVISFRPGGQFDFEVEYTNTEQIENIYLVSVREGIKKYVQLYYDENLKKYIYHGYFDEKNTSYVPGKLELQIINKEKRIPSILVELEGKKIDYLSSDFKEKYKIIDELNRDKFVTRIINRETQKVVLTEEISIDILKELFDNIQNNSESQPKKSSILVKEKENNLGFRSAEGTKGEPILNLFYALLLEEAGIINLNQFLNPAKFALDELYKIPELIFRKYAGLSKDLTTVSDNVFDGIKDKLLENKAVKDEIAKVPGLDKVVNNIGLFQELGNFVLKWSMLELLEKLLEEPKLVIQGNYKYNALQTIKREKNNFINSSIKSIGVSAASIGIHVRLGALIYDFGATLYNFSRGLGGKLEKWERIPTVSGLPESFYENIIDDLKIGAPTLTNWKVKTPSNNTNSNNTREEDIGTKVNSNSLDASNLFSVRYTTPHNNLSRFTSFNIPAFKFVVDPSGIVINNVSKNPVTGATINLYYQGENGEEVLWDAGEYSQFNPLVTTVNGEYAWDVPEGFWKVKVSKEGYESAESDWLPVPPPQTEVHFNLKPLSYKIAYKVGDGILKEDVPRSYQTDVDTELPYPVRKGYVFTGWYLDENFSGEPFFNTLFDKAGDKVLYAKWEKDTKILSDDDNVVTVTVSGNDVNVIGKVVKKEVTNADILEKVGDHNNLLMEIQALDDGGNVVSLSEDAKIELAVISGRKPYKVLHYVKDKSTFEEVPFNWNEKEKNISLTTSTLGVYLIQNKLTEKQMTSKVRQESRVLKTDKIEYVDDSSLDAGKVREVAAINGKVLVEITDIYVNGELQSSTEKELSRIEPQAKKVYRGTKQVSHVPNVAPMENNKPEAIIETKVRQEIRVLKTDKIEYVDDSSLDAGKVREVAAINGKVLVEITDVYVNGELQSSTEKELSRIEPQDKKVYRGTKQVSQVPDVAPIENNKPEAIIETKVRQEIRVLKTDKIEYVDDSSLDAGKVREVAAINGKVLVEITDVYVNGELQSSTEKELSRIEPQAKKVYRGTKQVSHVPDVAPIEVNRIERNNITKEHPEGSIVINTKLESVVMNQSSSEPLSSKETTIRTKGYLPNTSSEYGYGFELAGIIALATAHFGIISNKRKKNIKN